MHTRASDLPKCEFAVDSASDLRFFPDPPGRLIHVPVIFSLPGLCGGPR
jgi:hypothetical protein